MESYRPTMDSIKKPSRETSENGYRPTLSSIKPEYNLPEFPYVARSPTPEEFQQSNEKFTSAGLGAAQNFLNTPEQIANVFGGHLYNKFGFAPKNEAANMGGAIGDIASYFLPGGAISGSAKALSMVPRINELMRAGNVAMKSRPVTNFLAKMGRGAGEAALFQKAKSPESTPIDVTKAGGIGGLLSLAANAMTNQNPLINIGSKLGLGGLLGYQANGWPGALEGAGAAMFIPRMMGEIGIGKKPVAAEMLTSEPTEQAMQKYLAGRRIGDVGTPAEVFNSPKMGAGQGEIGRSEAGSNAMTQFGEQRVKQQQNSINNLLNRIFPDTKKSHNEIKNLYEKSYQNNISQNALHDLMEDPVISQASKKVFEDPVYAKDLKNIRPDNYAYLDQIKRAIDDMEQSAIRSGENNRARIYRDSSSNLTKVMDEEVPAYKQARDAAQRKIVHGKIMERMNKKPVSGKNFYREFLSNENKFNDLLHDVRNVKGADQVLKDMKLNWDNLIGYDTPATAAGMTAKHTNTARNDFQKFWNEFKDMFGAPRDVERAAFIQDPDWWKQFDEVIKYKSKLERNKKLADLVSRGISAGTLEYAREKAKAK